MFVNLVYHLVGFGVFVDPMMVWYAFVPQAKRALGRPADYGKFIFRIPIGVVHRLIRILLLNGGLRPTAALGFPPMA